MLTESMALWVVQLDNRSMSLESGRYMETVGMLHNAASDVHDPFVSQVG
jgi:hypothetical protein